MRGVAQFEEESQECCDAFIANFDGARNTMLLLFSNTSVNKFVIFFSSCCALAENTNKNHQVMLQRAEMCMAVLNGNDTYGRSLLQDNRLLQLSETRATRDGYDGGNGAEYCRRDYW